MGWFFKCVECRIKSLELQSLERQMESFRQVNLSLVTRMGEAVTREKIAIDALLGYQGKPGISTHQMSIDEVNDFMNPFSEVKSAKDIPAGVFEDIHGRESY